MTQQASSRTRLAFHPLTPDRWRDLEALFGPRGASSGCWCMWWRLTRSQFARQAGRGNKEALQRIVKSGEVPGILAYANGQPVGWCSVAPRQAFASLERSPTLKRVDDTPVWSVVCFYVAPAFRRQGVMLRLLTAAVKYARRHGAQVVEAYPMDPSPARAPTSAAFSGAYMGVVPAFRQAGFVEVLRRSERHLIMRRFVRNAQGRPPAGSGST